VSVACVSVVEFCQIEKEEIGTAAVVFFFLHWLFLFFDLIWSTGRHEFFSWLM
jgi:hypothetical protein